MTSGSGSNDPKGAPGNIAGGGSASFSSKMMRQIVETAPSTTVQVDLADLPVIPLPSLEGIEIRVPATNVTEDDVLERYQHLYYNQCVERKLRDPGTPIEMGDEMLVDMLGYLEGRIIPFSAQQNLVFCLEDDVIQPGFGTKLAGTNVGETKVITIALPHEDEFGAETKLTAAFVVEVKAAASLTFPKADSPESLAKLGFEGTIDEAYKSIAEDLVEERANSMAVEGMNMALKAICDRVTTPVPPKLVQDQVKGLWSQSEGRYLEQKGIDRQDLDAALESWLQSEEIQEDARQKLKINMVLLAAAREEDQELQPGEVGGFVEELAKSMGINLEAWQEAVAEDEDAQIALFNTYLHIRTMTHLVAKIPIQYEE